MSRRSFLRIVTLLLGGFGLGWRRSAYAFDLPGGIPASKLVAWYAARHTTGFSDGAFVATIPDLTGGGADLFQNHSAKRATFQTNEVNGLPVFRFDGTDWYKTQWGTVPEPYCVFIVFNPKAIPVAGKNEVMFSGYDNLGSDKHIFAIVNHDLATVNQPTTPPDWMIEQAGNSQHVVGGTPQSDLWYVARCDFETIDSITLNGALTDAVGNAGSLASKGLTLGAREDGNRGLVGDIAELVFCRDLTVAEKLAIEADLMEAYGI